MTKLSIKSSIIETVCTQKESTVKNYSAHAEKLVESLRQRSDSSADEVTTFIQQPLIW